MVFKQMHVIRKACLFLMYREGEIKGKVCFILEQKPMMTGMWKQTEITDSITVLLMQ